MNLRTKTIIIISAVFISAILVMALLLSRFITNSYSQEENQITRDKILQAMDAIEDDWNSLENTVIDWAEWDDSYQFMEDHNQNYIDSNLTNSTFFNNNLNLIAYIDNSANIIYSQAYNFSIGEPEPISENLRSYLLENSKFISSSKQDNGVKGLISLDDTALIIVSHPVLTSQGGGPSRGTLIFGRYLDSRQLGRLPVVSKLNLKGYRINDPEMPEDVRNVIANVVPGVSISVQVLSDEIIAGYAILNDINEQPAYILKIDSQRVLYLQAQNDVFYFTMALLAFGLLFIIVIMLILERFVISRVTNLSTRVSIIGKKGDLSARISYQGKDEISSLASNINGMLENLEQSRILQKESETFNYALLQESPNPIVVMNLDGSIRFINPALEKITGYSESQLIGRKLPYPWVINDNLQLNTEELQSIIAKGTSKTERNYRRANGEYFWVEITSTVIKQDHKIKYIIANWTDITERKQAEEALKHSENRFRELAELLPELVFECDLTGRLVFVNRIAFSVFGYSPEECQKLSLTDLIAPEDQLVARSNMAKMLAGEEIGNTEYNAIRKDNTRFPVFLHSTQVKNSLGEVIGLRGILVDITTQKEIEAELRGSEEFSSSLLNNAPNPIIVSNIDTSIRYINPALEKLTGFSSLEVIGKTAPYPWHQEGQVEQINNGLSPEEGKETKSVERCYRKKNGEIFWVTITNNPFIENGKIQYYIGNWVDITERKRTEDALKESEAFSTSLRDNSPYPIMVINPDTSIRYINPALEKLSGYTADELIGHLPPYPFWTEEESEKYAKYLPTAMSGNQKIEALLRKKSGESFFVEITSTNIMEGESLKYSLSIWVDITTQKTASEQLEKLYQREKTLREALQAEIRSRIEYTRALVHELKTPLTPILASSELLVEELTQEPLLGLAKNVHRGAVNMNRRVDELLDLARGEIGMLKVNLNPVDIERLLPEIIKYMEPSAKSNGQTLSLTVQDKLPIVMADDDRIRQILFNLISNSIKYSYPGGNIDIVARIEKSDIIIEVKDTGRGMSEEEQKKLFQPYYRIEGKEHLSGLGLGLTLSKNLIELQNGHIWVQSEKGKGSIFSFSIPIKADTPIDNKPKTGG